MGVWAQLKLLLHKNFLLRARQPTILALEVLWPVAVILMVLALRLVVPPRRQETCYYNARALPSAGGIPFLQSLICNIDNDCNNASFYEEIPSYKGSKVDELVQQVSPLMSDNDIISLVKALPKGVNLMRAVIDTLAIPSIQQILEKGLPLNRFLKDPGVIKDILHNDAKINSPAVAEALTQANISIHKLLEIVGTPFNLSSMVCDPNLLKNYLVLKDNRSLKEVSNVLCALDGPALSKLVDKVQNEVDSGKVIKMISDLMSQFGRPDVGRMLEDIGTMVDTILNLPSLVFSNSKAANATKWLPRLKSLVEPLKVGDVNLGLIGDITRDIEPLFDGTKSGKKIQSLLKYVSTISALVRNGLQSLPESNPKMKTFLTNATEVQVHLLNIFNPAILDAILESRLKPEMESYLRESRKKPYEIFCEEPGLVRLFDYGKTPKTWEELQTFQDSVCILFLNGSSLNLVEREINEHSKVESHVLFVNNTGEILNLIRSLGTELSGFKIEYLVLVQNLFDSIITTLSTNGFDGIKVGNIIDSIMEIMEQTKYWDGMKIGHAVMYNIFNITLDQVLTESSMSYEKGLDVFWPFLAESVLLTLSDSQRWPRMLNLSTWPEVACDPEIFMDVFLVPGGVDTMSLQTYICDFLGRTHLLIEEAVSRNYTRPKDLDWSIILVKLEKIVAFTKRSMEDENFVDAYNWKRLETAYESFRNEVWGKRDSKGRTNVIVNSLKQFSDWLAYAHFKYINDFKALFYALHKLITLVNRQFQQVIADNSVQSKHLAFDMPTLTQVIREFVSILPDMIRLAVRIITDPRPMLMKMGTTRDYLTKIPCIKGSVTEFLDFQNKTHVQNLEKLLCRSGQSLAQETLSNTDIGLMLSAVHNVSVGESLDFSWEEVEANLIDMQENVVKLSNFNGTIFPDVPKFNLTDLKTAVNETKEQYEIINDSYGNRKFIFALADTFLQLLDNTSYVRKPTFATLKWKTKKGPDVFGNLVVSSKFAFWTGNEMLEEITKYLVKLQRSELSMYDLLNTSLLRDLWEILMNFPYLTEVFIKSLLNPAFSDVIEDIIHDKHLNTMCSSYSAFEQVMQFGEERRDLGETFFIILCELSKDNWQDVFNQLWRGSAFSGFIERVSKAWYRTNPSNVPVRLLSFFDKVNRITTIIKEVMENPPKFIWGGEKTILMSSVWESFANSSLQIIKSSANQRFTIAFQPLVHFFTKLAKSAQYDVATEMEKGTIFMDKFIEGLLKIKENKTLSLKDVIPMDNQETSLIKWAEEYLRDGVEALMYTLALDSRKFSQFLRLNQTVKSIVCNNHLSSYLLPPPHVTDRKHFEEGRDILCKNNWFIKPNTTSKRKNVPNTPNAKPRKFFKNLGRVMDILVNEATLDFTFLSRTSSLLSITNWSPVIERFYKYYNLKIEDTGAWIKPVVEKMVTAMGDQGHMVKSLNDIMASVSCTLSKVRNGIRWNYKDMRHDGDRMNFMAFVKMLNDSVDFVQMALNTLEQPQLLQNIMEDFVVLREKKNAFCTVNNDQWKRYFVINNGDELSALNSLQILVCKTNYTAALIEMNPAVYCQLKTENSPMALVSTDSVARNMRYLYDNVTNVIALRYLKGSDPDTVGKFVLPWRNATRWHNIFKTFAENVDQSLKNFTIRSLAEWLSVVGIMFEEYPSVWIGFQFFHESARSFVKHIEPLMTDPPTPIPLERAFPKSPYIRQILKLWLPNLPTLIETSMWSMMAPNRILPLLTSRHGHVKPSVCRNSIREHFYNPRLKEEDWESLQHMLCNISYNTLLQEAKQITIINLPILRQTAPIRALNWNVLSKDVNRLVEFLKRITIKYSVDKPNLNATTWSHPNSLLTWKGSEPSRLENDVPIYLTLNAISHDVRSTLGFVNSCRRNSSLNTEFGVHPDLFEMICVTGQEELKKENFQQVQTILKVINESSKGQDFDFPAFYQAVLNVTGFKEVVKGIAGDKTLNQWIKSEEDYMDFLKRIKVSLEVNQGANDRLKIFPTSLKGISTYLLNVTGLVPILNTFSPIINNLADGIRALNRTVRIEEVLAGALPTSPSTRGILETLIHQSHDLLPTLMWTALMPQRVQKLTHNSRQLGIEALHFLCNSSLSDYLYNPAFNSRDWARIQSSLCSYNLTQVWTEIRSLVDVSSMTTLNHSPLSNPFEMFGDSFVNLMSAISKQSELSKLEEKYIEMSKLALEPEVMTYVIYHNTFRRFCDYVSIQFRNLPVRRNKEDIQDKFCYMSTEEFASQVGSNIGKLLILSSRRTSNQRSIEWQEIYHSIIEVLGYEDMLKVLMGDHHFGHLRKLQSHFQKLVMYQGSTVDQRSLPEALEKYKPILLKSSDGRKVLHYFSFILNYLKPTFTKRIMQRSGHLTFRVLLKSQIEASFHIRQLLNAENMAIDAILDFKISPVKLLELLFEDAVHAFCNGSMSTWATVDPHSGLKVEELQALMCSESGKVLVKRLTQRIDVNKLMGQLDVKKGLQWSDIFDGYFQMTNLAVNVALDMEAGEWHLVDSFKLDRYVQNVLKASNILNAYKVTDALVNVLKFVDKFGKYSDEWQTGMGFFRAILDATNYYLLSDSNKDIYSIISNGTHLGEFFKRVLGSQQESPSSLSSRQVLHAVDVMSKFYEMNKDQLASVCHKVKLNEGPPEVDEIVEIFCKNTPTSWINQMSRYYKKDKAGSYIKHSLTAVARLVMSSNPEIQTKIRFWLHKSNVEDLIPMIQNLISKFVKAPGGLYRLEGQLLKPIPLAIWEAIPTLLKAQDDLWCLHENISLSVLTASNLIHTMVSKIPDPELILCELPKWSLAKLYHWASKNFEFKKLARLAQQFVSQRHDPRIECVTPLSVLSDSMNLVSRVSRAFNTPKRHKEIKECVDIFHNATLVINLQKYGSFFKNITSLLEEFNLSATKNISSLNEVWVSISDFISSQLPVFHSLTDLIWNIRGFEKALLSPQFNMTDDTVKALLNASLNLNWLARKNFSKEAVSKAICEKQNLRPVMRLPALSLTKKAVIVNVLCKKGGIVTILDALDSARIIKEIPSLQHQELLKGDWLEQLINNIQSIMNHFLDLASVSGKLLNKFSAGITSDVLTTVVQILRENTVDNLLTSLQGLLEKIEPVLEGSRIAEDLQMVLQGMRSLKSLQGLNLFNVHYRLQDLFGDSGTLKVGDFLREELDLHESAVSEVLDGQLDLTKILSSKNLVESVQNIMCNPVELSQLLKINSPDVTAENITHALCSLSSGQALKVSSQLLNQLAFSRIIENFVEVGINGVLGKVNLTWTEALQAFNALKSTPTVMPKLRQYTSVVTSALDPALQNEFKKLNISTEGIRLLGTPAALNAFGNLLCGKTLKALNQELQLLQLSNKEPTPDTQEIEDLPSQFCRTGYEQVLRMTGGPILWGFLKPILRGKILYAPKNKVTEEVFKQVNKTFENFSGFITALQAWGEGIAGLHYLQERSDLLEKMKELLGTPAVQPILKQVVGDDATSILDQFDISSINNQLKNVSGLLDLMQLVGNMSQCFELNRFHGFDTEAEVEFAAQRLSMKREFIAGLIFLDEEEEDDDLPFRKKRSIDRNSFPTHIRYKIRMDIDNVPTTRRKKLQFWQPGPRDDFLDEMRYFRGFLQYQEMIDNAILHVQTNGKVPIRPLTYLQQFPYPCYQQDRFGVFLKGMLPIIISGCWLFLVAFLIREYVIEKELKLEEVLRVMGLKQWVGWIAWYVCGLCILSFGVAICVCVLKFGGIFPYSNGLIIFLFCMEFAVLVVMYCYLISTLFRTATIAALTGIIIYLLTFLPFVLIVSLDSQLNLWQKLITSLLMCTSFCYGCLHINRYETHGVGIQWDNIWHPVHEDEMNFVYSVIMIAVDVVVYFIIGWYISNVWPHNSARKRPWYFPLTLSYWGLCKKKRKFNYFELPDAGQNIGHFFGEDFKGSAEERKLANTEEHVVGISLRGLSVIYNRGKPMERVAVSSLTLDFMEGHITTLLGQNGAGKTTTINVLTGQYPPTLGSVYVYGKSIPYQFSEVQKTLGYCPQYNTLFARMTVREHLKFYAQLKGVLSGKKLEDDVDEMLNSMGLTHKQHEQTRYLSGGMQRRLCVALAFIGGSKVIILDEPTSSVDPVARRSIWDLIVKYRHGRTILLTTHHMDEADILSDKVAIVHKGKLLCYGSPLLLKSKFGCGYQLIMARQCSPEHDNDSGRASSSCSSESDASETENILTFIQAYVPMARLMEDNGAEVVISLPQRDGDGKVYAFGNLFKQLDASINTLGYSSYGISSTTLEEVFLTLCGLDDNTALPVSHSEPLPMRRNSIIKPNCDHIDKMATVNGKSPLTNDYSYVNGAYIGSALDFGCKEPIRGYKLKLNQFHALLLKRYYHFLHDWRAICSSILLPCAFIAIAMGFSLLEPAGQGSKEPSILLSPPMYGPNAINFFSFNGAKDGDLEKTLNPMLTYPGLSNACLKTASPEERLWCYRNVSDITENEALLAGGGLCFDEDESLRIKNSKEFYKDIPVMRTNTGDYLYNLTDYDLNRYLLDTYIANTESRYGGFSFLDRKDGQGVVKVWYDNSGFHATPAFANSLNNALLRANMKELGMDPSVYGITVFNHPLQVTTEQLGRSTIMNKAGELGVALVIFLGFAFIPTSFVVYIVKERIQEEKRLQYVAGVGPVLYWFSAFIWDMFLVIIAVIISTVIILIFGLPLYVAKLNLPGIFVLLLLFGWATTPLMYLMEKLFSEASIAFMVLYCLNIFIGVSIMVSMLVLGLFSFGSGTRFWLDLAESIALVTPQYCLMGGLVSMAQNHIQAEIFAIFGQDTYESPFSWNVVQRHMLALAIEGFLLFSANLLLEVRWASLLPAPKEKGPLPPDDSDVAEERKRVESDASRNDVLKIKNIKKIFNSDAGQHVAVNNVTFGIPKGECFGLLGVNGAGKTTLFRILTGHITSTSGQAFIGGEKISKVLSSNSELLGYCPQADALDDLLSPEQHFIIYGKLRGIPKKDLKLVVQKAMAKFELKIYTNRHVGTLSRGTKRKVCTAISMLGNPQIVLLDEPTTGMDPVTRRLVWNNVLQTVKDNRSVLLTSHSMEECDVLCSRLAIMVNGRIRCLGSPQLLKYKFGTGYTISLRVRENVEDLNNIMDFMLSFFPSAILRAHHYNMIEFSLPEKNIPLHDIFGHLEVNQEKLGIKDFSISQTTLDQVFVSFARQQGDEVTNVLKLKSKEAAAVPAADNQAFVSDDQTSIKLENLNNSTLEEGLKEDPDAITLYVDDNVEATKF